MIYTIVGDQLREIEYDNIIKKIKSSFPNIQEKIYDAAQGEGDLFLSSIQSNSMFANKELLILKRAENLSPLSDLFQTLSLFNFENKEIIIDIEKKGNNFGKKAETLAKNIGKVFQVANNPKSDLLIEYIEKELNIDGRDAFQLKSMLGSDINLIKNEIEKIKLFLANEAFDINKVKNIISIKEEYNIFQIIDKLVKGNKEDAFNYIQANGNTHLFLYNLAQEFKNILRLKLLYKGGKIKINNNYNSFMLSYNENKEDFRTAKSYLHPYGAFKKLENLKYYNIERLKEILYLILDTEFKIKSGYADEKILIDLLIAKI